jgi:NCAIR mutase (PurE)-related protein
LEEDVTRKLLERVAAGEVSVADAMRRLRAQPFVDLGYAKPDIHRAVRQGAAEVVFGAGKTSAQMYGIVTELLRQGQSPVLITRLDSDKASALGAAISEAPLPAGATLDYHPEASVGVVGELPEPDGNGTVAVCAAGTSDLYCAEEAALTAESMGSRVERIYDVGVSGLHRLLAHLDQIQSASSVVAVAGMEGALASVIGGLVDCPVIAVPTSVGYGASFGGLAALLSMLNSCASGVSVVNIDNGFGAGYQASLIDHARRR